MKRKLMSLLGGAAGAVVLSACAGGGTNMTEAMDQVPAPEEPYVAFTDMEWFRELSEEDLEARERDYRWSTADLAVGFDDLGPYLMQGRLDGLPLDLYALDQALRVGFSAEASGALIGDLDADALHAELTERGWEGEDVLRVTDDVELSHLVVFFPQVVIDDKALVYARHGVDLEEGSSAAEDERFAPYLDCLGEVVAGQIIQGVAVGVAPDDEDLPRGVICAAGDPESLSAEIVEEIESGRNPYTDREYGDDLIEPEADPHSELARVYVSFPERGEHDQLLTSVLFMMHQQGNLPGLIHQADQEFQEWLEDTLSTPPGGGEDEE
ncbi:hypothetical protein [Nesterenkonia ebinurensis]|uniref:hypothetical protein n=1 Tax=Nesterenkonia ebinurensis TaxID=2608252 RepID=UPI00123D319E|nr:hypothetical protein [Nesterenkonia ebinurensis]